MRIPAKGMLAIVIAASLGVGGCQLIPDTEDPQVDLDVSADQVSIAADAETGRAVIEVLVEATDDRELDEVWLEIDGEPYEDSRETAIGDLGFDDEFVVELEPGSHDLAAVAIDASGNEDRSRAQGIEVAESGTGSALAAGQIGTEEMPAGELPQGHPDIGGTSAGVLPAGKTPRQYVEGFCDAVIAQEYESAFKMLPAANQTSYGSARSFAEQVAAYGITGYSIGDATETGDTVRVESTLETPQMDFVYTWTFTRSGDGWSCTERSTGGS